MIDTNSEYQWHGSSQALNQLERRLKKFSGVNFPILIRGDKGTGKQIAAYRIHQVSNRKHAEFITECCLQWRESDVGELFHSAHTRAIGGTLFVKNINSLSSSSILKLQHYWEREYMGKSVPTRIICSLSPFYDKEHIIESSAPWLSLELPTLNERKDDISALINVLKIKYKNVQNIEIAEECWPYIIANNWPDNVKGLERFIAKLVVLSEMPVIQKSTLFELFPAFKHIDISKEKSLQHSKILGHEPRLGVNNINSLAQSLLEHKIPNESSQHLAISRSLAFIKDQFHEKISIDNVAKTACVSSPHLSFLFRKHLGISFKQLLLQLRIEQSKQLLRDNPEMQITQISYETGFHDLSHFEKTFRKLVGVCPSYYRRQTH